MPRRLRLLLPGVAGHFIQRGSNRVDCFRRESDYLVYLALLRDSTRRLDCEVHAYCLMTNHIHLLVSPASAEAGEALMKDLGQKYAQYFNRTYSRSGPLWDGRYRSCLVESARYVLACYRYIELNPVRAGMVDHPARYRWSSYAINAVGVDDALLSPHAEFLALATSAAGRRSAYAALFADTLEPAAVDAIRDATNGGYPMGGDAFKARISALGYKTCPSPPGPKPKRSGSDPEFRV